MSAGAGDLAGRVFSSRYRRGVLLAPKAGCLLAPVLVLPGALLLQNILLGIGVAFATLIVSAWIFTARRRMRPALSLSAQGMRLDGLPLIAWSDVMSVRRDPDSRAEPALLIRLRRFPAKPGAIITPAPLWRLPESDTLRLRVSLLEDAPGDVEEAFRVFLR